MKASCNGLLLKAIWDFSVSKGELYKLPQQELDAESFVLLYCEQGQGLIDYKPNESLELKQGEVLLLDSQSFLAYRAMSQDWNFWWVEFSSLGQDQFCPNGPEVFKGLEIPQGLFEGIQDNFRKRTIYHRGAAAASFNDLLYTWQLSLQKKKSNGHEVAVNKVINEMYKRSSDCWTLKEMSKVAEMGEENFRKVFSRLTGSSPKKFYNNLRLNMAEAVLRRGPYSVAEVADLFNFTDAFHFSKSFKKHFSYSPSKIKSRKTRQLVS